MRNCNSNNTINIYRGTTYSQVYRWGIEPFIYKTISAVPSLTPLTMTVTAHGVPPGWSVAVTDLNTFPSGINASEWPPCSDDYFAATVVDTNTLAFNDVDAARLGSYSAGSGSIGFLTPVNLTGATATFSIYPYPAVTTPPVAALTVNATLDNTGKTITVALTAANTTALTGQKYSYVLVATDSSSNVTVLDQGLIVPQALGTGT